MVMTRFLHALGVLPVFVVRLRLKHRPQIRLTRQQAQVLEQWRAGR
jgi:hypothetical protein